MKSNCLNAPRAFEVECMNAVPKKRTLFSAFSQKALGSRNLVFHHSTRNKLPSINIESICRNASWTRMLTDELLTPFHWNECFKHDFWPISLDRQSVRSVLNRTTTMNHSIDCSKACRHHEEQLLKRSPSLRGRMHERLFQRDEHCSVHSHRKHSAVLIVLSPQYYSEQTTLNQHRKHLS
jgi:hypothetical protein